MFVLCCFCYFLLQLLCVCVLLCGFLYFYSKKRLSKAKVFCVDSLKVWYKVLLKHGAEPSKHGDPLASQVMRKLLEAKETAAL